MQTMFALRLQTEIFHQVQESQYAWSGWDLFNFLLFITEDSGDQEQGTVCLKCEDGYYQ